MQRRQGRELALQMLFASSYFPENEREQGLLVLESSEPDSEVASFAKTLFLGILKSRAEIDKIISKHLENWDLSRLWLVDKSILQIAIYELLFLKDSPPSVVIDQAVRLAKKFGGDESGSFVNGILGAIFRSELNAKGKTEDKG